MTPAEYNRHLYKPGWYARDWKAARAALKSGIAVRVHLYDFPRTYRTLEEFDRDFRSALDRRINARANIQPRGRKDDWDWEMRMSRDARSINDHFTKRVALRLCNLSTQEMRERYAGRIPGDYSED